jgi:hypothetical protein
MRLLMPVAVMALFCGSVALAFSQSFNISLECSSGSQGQYGFDVPTAAFGAAAHQYGYWNDCPATVGIWPLLPMRVELLRDIAGRPTLVTLTRGHPGGGAGWWNPQVFNQTSGDYAALMTDAREWPDDVLTVTNLQPGNYTIYTYAVPPSNAPRHASVFVENSTSQNPQQVLGPLHGNVLIQFQTHAVHDVVVSGTGTLRIRVSPIESFDTYVNGFQFVYHGPGKLIRSAPAWQPCLPEVITQRRLDFQPVG